MKVFDVITEPDLFLDTGKKTEQPNRSKFLNIIYRKKQSYSSHDGRIAQVLRHLARLLFVYGKNTQSSLQEVQVMLAEKTDSSMKGKQINLYISYSPFTKDDKSFNAWDISVSQIIEVEYAKLSKTKDWMLKKSIDRLKKLKNVKNDVVEKIFQKFKDKLNICHPKISKRHAEEYLCDKAEELRRSDPKSNWIFRIYGKKRPCMTCVGRMKASKIDMFKDRPGLVWRYCLNLQVFGDSENKISPNLEAAISSLRLLMTTPSHDTFSEGNYWGRSYDTDSESDFDEANE